MNLDRLIYIVVCRQGENELWYPVTLRLKKIWLHPSEAGCTLVSLIWPRSCGPRTYPCVVKSVHLYRWPGQFRWYPNKSFSKTPSNNTRNVLTIWFLERAFHVCTYPRLQKIWWKLSYLWVTKSESSHIFAFFGTTRHETPLLFGSRHATRMFLVPCDTKQNRAFWLAPLLLRHLVVS